MLRMAATARDHVAIPGSTKSSSAAFFNGHAVPANTSFTIE